MPGCSWQELKVSLIHGGSNLEDMYAPSLPLLHTHTRTQSTKLGWEVLEGQNLSLALQFARGLQYGRVCVPPPQGPVGTLAAFLALSPSRPHAYIWTHAQTGGQARGPYQPLPFLLDAGPQIGDMWLGQMRHDVGLSLWQILRLSACLKIVGAERLKKKKKSKKEFCFSAPLICTACPVLSPLQILDIVAFSPGIYRLLWQ